jgi:hypothetical protein
MQTAKALIGIGELSELLELHRTTIERLFLKGVIVPEAYLQAGRTDRPLFDPKKLGVYKTCIDKFKSDGESLHHGVSENNDSALN